MSENRVFFPQQTVDAWLDEGRIVLSGSELSIGGTREHFRLQGALHFVADVAETGDPHELVGKVKTLEDVQELHGEHCADSVVLGESAYQVVEGFLAVPLPSRDAVLPASAEADELDAAHPLAQLLSRLQTG